MLTFDDNGDGKIVALFQSYHNKNRRMVYLTKRTGSKQYSFGEQRLLKALEHGKSAVRYKKHVDDLQLNTNMDILQKPDTQGAFLPFYIPEERFVHVINGKGGSGKSYKTKLLAELYGKIGLKVYIVSPKPDDWAKYGTVVKIDELVVNNSDKSYEEQLQVYEEAKLRFKHAKKELKDPEMLIKLELKVNQMKPKKATKKQVAFKFTDKYKELLKEPTLWVYDDTEALDETAKLKFIQNSQLLTGRSAFVNMIIINHLTTNGHDTRLLLIEGHIFTLFEMSKINRYFLETYLRLDGKVISLIEELLTEIPREEFPFVSININHNVIVSKDKVIKFS